MYLLLYTITCTHFYNHCHAAKRKLFFYVTRHPHYCGHTPYLLLPNIKFLYLNLKWTEIKRSSAKLCQVILMLMLSDPYNRDYKLCHHLWLPLLNLQSISEVYALARLPCFLPWKVENQYRIKSYITIA